MKSFWRRRIFARVFRIRARSASDGCVRDRRAAQRLVERRHRRRVAAHLEPHDAEPVERERAVEIAAGLRQRASAVERRRRLGQLPQVVQRPAVRERVAQREPALVARVCDLRAHRLERRERLGVAVRLDRRLGPHERRLGRGDRRRAGVALDLRAADAEPDAEPLDGRVGGRRLAELDLAHVLLAEAVAAELRLGKARRHAQRPHARAGPGCRVGCARARAVRGGGGASSSPHTPHTSARWPT